MLKKVALAVFGLVFALALTAPQAQAEVHFGVAIAAPGVYGAVAVHPAHYVAYDNAPYTAYNAAPYAYYDAAPNGAYAEPYYGSSPNYYYGPAERHEGREREYRRGCRDNRWEHERHEHEREHRRGDRW
jgi:hypothetical protein